MQIVSIDLIYSIDNATEGTKFTKTNAAKTAVILSVVFGGLLGLCLVVCIVGVLMKRKCRRKRKTKSGKFTSAVFNPVFHR